MAVPCWNEQNTVEKTLNSLLELDYPKDKLTIIAVDDGSTDNTWEALKKFEKYPNIKILKKEKSERLRHDIRLAPEWIRSIMKTALPENQKL